MGGFDCDFSVLPTRAQRREFVTEYVRAYFRLAKDGSCDVDSADEVDKLIREVDLYRGVPGFYWGIWALIQATISEIDFDYASYAEVRLGEYWAWRAELDGSREASGKAMPAEGAGGGHRPNNESHYNHPSSLFLRMLRSQFNI